MHHAALDRPRAHDRDFDHEVVKAARLQARQHAHLRTRFDLEYPHRVGPADHGVDGRVFRRNIFDAHCAVFKRVEHIQRTADRGQHAERQHIHFQQPEGIQIIFVPLDHGALWHGGVFNRHQLRQWAGRDDEAAGMLRQMTRKADQFAREFERETNRRAVAIKAGFGQTRFNRVCFIPPLHGFGEAPGLLNRETECLADILKRRARPVSGERCRQRSAFAPVFAVDILNHFFAPSVFEIDINVGRLVALFRDETLEQNLYSSRVDLGDAEAIAHRRIGRRATPLTQDALPARETHNVMHGQKKRLVGQITDQQQLAFDQGDDMHRHLC